MEIEEDCWELRVFCTIEIAENKDFDIITCNPPSVGSLRFSACL